MFLFYFGSASFLSWHHHWGAKSITVNSSWKGLVRQACLPSPKMFHHNFSPQYGWDNDGGETHLKIEAMRHISLNLIKWEYTLLGQKKKNQVKDQLRESSWGSRNSWECPERDAALTVAGRQWTDCSATNRSVNSTSFSNSGKCSISIPTYTNNRERQIYQKEGKQTNFLC